jgi:hypothetical protein
MDRIGVEFDNFSLSIGLSGNSPDQSRTSGWSHPIPQSKEPEIKTSMSRFLALYFGIFLLSGSNPPQNHFWIFFLSEVFEYGNM